MQEGKYKLLLDPDTLQLAERYLIAESQAGLDTSKILSLLPETGTVRRPPQ